jgi:hypothetical protein
VVARDDREPQRVRHPLLVHPAVGCEREHRLDQLLEAERGTNLADEVGRLVADVLEAVRRARGHDDAIARAGDDRLRADAECELPGEHLEALLLGPMEVGGCDRAIRLDDRLDDDGHREAQAFALAHVAYYDLERGDREGAARAVADALRTASDGGGLWVTAIGLLFASQTLLAYDVEREAALLLGSAHASFDGVGEGRWETERHDWEPILEELERKLGREAQPLLDEGSALLPDQAIQRALEVIPSAAPSPTSGGPS